MHLSRGGGSVHPSGSSTIFCLNFVLIDNFSLTERGKLVRVCLAGYRTIASRLECFTEASRNRLWVKYRPLCCRGCAIEREDTSRR